MTQHNKPVFKLEITLDKLTHAQALAVEEMFATWQTLSSQGSSRMVGFLVDGDGNFHPEITINGQQPSHEPLAVVMEPNFFKERDGRIDIDFDAIAWKLREAEDKPNRP